MPDNWKILRVLTTNQCNYRCLYCHNEGQEKSSCIDTLSYEDFIRIMQIIAGLGFQEIRFSGGEPLVNPNTIRMIEWLDSNSDYEIGLATNGSFITEEIAQRLSKTRTLITMHFPAVDEAEYERVTGRSSNAFNKAIDILDRYGVKHSFNFVLYPETVNNMDAVVDSVVKSGKRVKLLPFIESGFNNISKEIVCKISSKLDNLATTKKHDDVNGIFTWEFDNGGKVKLLDSPCYKHDIKLCREYGELRLLPDLSLQKCIFDTNPVSLAKLNDDEIRMLIIDLWNSFDKCL